MCYTYNGENMSSELVYIINDEITVNGIKSIEELILSGIQTSIIIELLYNNSNTFRNLEKTEMHKIANYIDNYDMNNDKVLM